MNLPDKRLVLFPADPQATVPETMLPALHACGLAGADFIQQGRHCLFTGAEFLHWITFLGCAPVIRIEATGGTLTDNIYYLEWLPPTPAPRLLGAYRQPRCPHCRQGVTDWREHRQQWQRHEFADLRCSRCGAHNPPASLDWRRCGGFARCALVVWGVFESEAVPTDALLALLQRESGGVAWKYFYACL